MASSADTASSGNASGSDASGGFGVSMAEKESFLLFVQYALIIIATISAIIFGGSVLSAGFELVDVMTFVIPLFSYVALRHAYLKGKQAGEASALEA